MKRFAIVLALGALVGASFVRLPKAGDAVNPQLVDGELQAVFAPPSTNLGGGFATGDGIDAGTATGLSLADALTLERRASLWWEYARDIASVVSHRVQAGIVAFASLVVSNAASLYGDVMLTSDISPHAQGRDDTACPCRPGDHGATKETVRI